MMSSPVQRGRFVRVLGFAFACALLASLSSSQTSQSNPPPASFAAPPISSVSGTEVGQTGFWSVTKGDFNGDGILDFAVAGFNCSNGTSIPADSIAVYLGNGDGTFESPHTYPAGHCPNQIVAGRFRGANAPEDLIVVGLSDVSVLLGNGDGSFQNASTIGSFSPVSTLAASVGDFNGDGKSDVAIALFTGLTPSSAGLYDSIAVLLGNGDGTFQTPLYAQSPGNNNYEIHLADVNNDGKLDLVTRTGLPQTLFVSLGNGDGTFLPAYPIWSPPNSIFLVEATGLGSFTIGDFNGDGNLDIAADENGQRVDILLGTGTGAFVPVGTYQIDLHQAGGDGLGQIGAAQLSSSGHVDLVIGTGYGATLVILHGNGDGTFQITPTVYPLPQNDEEALIVADLNGDGLPDVLVGTSEGQLSGIPSYLSVLLNRGNGDFGPPPALFSVASALSNNAATATNAVGVTLADLTGNGNLDCVVTDFDLPVEPLTNGQMPPLPTLNLTTDQVDTHGSISVLPGNGDGTFGAEQQYFVGGRPIAVAAADLTGDSHKDLVVVNAFDGTLSVLKGNGDRTFQAAISITVGTNPTSLAVADLNGDHKPDVVVTNLVDGTISVLINQSTPGSISFAAPVNYSVGTYPDAVVAQDFNHDGKTDLVVLDGGYFFASDDAGKHAQLSVLFGNGDGTFAPAVTTKIDDRDGADALVAADFGRGELDLAVGHFNKNQVIILQGDGQGNFSKTASYNVGEGPESMAAMDFNGDGKIDIAVSGLNDHTVALLLGNGDGTFVPAANRSDDIRPFGWATWHYPAFMAAGDLNGDGKPEIVTTHLFEAAVAVLRNLTVTPVRLIDAVSRKVQGSATFDVDLSIGNAIECRSGGSNGDYTLVFKFANPLASVGGASVTSGTGTVRSNAIGADAHEYIVNLTGVTNAQTITVSLNNITDSLGNFSSAASTSMSVLIGDTNADRSVDSADISQVKSQSGNAVNSSNFREDLNGDGFIDSADIGFVKSKSGTALP